MNLFEMAGEVFEYKWETPFFAGEDTATAKINTPTGDATIMFDERGEGDVEVMIVGDDLNPTLAPTLRAVIQEYRQQHPNAKLSFHPDNRTKGVSGFVQKFIQ